MSLRTMIARTLAMWGDELMRGSVVTYPASQVTAAATTGSTMASKLAVSGASKPAENAILAYACLMARREAIGSAPLMITDTEDNAIESGPLAELLAQPNESDDWSQYVRKLETHLTFYNACAIYLGPESEGAPSELVPLHPDGLQPVVGVHVLTGTTRVMRWNYTDPVTFEQREFKTDEVLAHVGYNPHAPLATLSPLRVLERTIKADIAAREQNLGLFVNDANVRGYLHTDQPATKPQMQEVLDAWNSAYAGYMSGHKTAALWGGVKYDRVQLTPAELEFMESLRQMRIDYYMAFRVYPAMLAEMTGETGLSQGSSTESQRMAWWEDVGLPELGLIAAIHQRVAKRFGTLARGLGRGRALTRTERWALSRSARPGSGAPVSIWFNDAAIPALARNRTSRTETSVKLVSIGYRPDEVNDYLQTGLPPHTDNEGRVPFSMQVIGEELKPEPRNLKPGGDGENPAVERLARIERFILNRAEGNRKKWDLRRQQFERLIGPLEKAASRKWSRFFLEQRERVLARMAAESERLGRSDASDRAKKLVDKIFPRPEEDAALIARLTPLWAEQMGAGWDYLQSEIGESRDRPFQIDDPRVMRALENRKLQGIKGNDTTGEKLRDILAEAFEAGDNAALMADRIAGYYSEQCVGADSARAMTAARTQTAGIVNEGRMLAARDAGGLRKTWVHGNPKEPREAHVAAAEYYQAHPIGMDEMFEVNGVRMDAPGDSSAPPEEVCNCTCSVGFVRGE